MSLKLSAKKKIQICFLLVLAVVFNISFAQAWILPADNGKLWCDGVFGESEVACAFRETAKCDVLSQITLMIDTSPLQKGWIDYNDIDTNFKSIYNVSVQYDDMINEPLVENPLLVGGNGGCSGLCAVVGTMPDSCYTEPHSYTCGSQTCYNCANPRDGKCARFDNIATLSGLIRFKLKSQESQNPALEPAINETTAEEIPTNETVPVENETISPETINETAETPAPKPTIPAPSSNSGGGGGGSRNTVRIPQTAPITIPTTPSTITAQTTNNIKPTIPIPNNAVKTNTPSQSVSLKSTINFMVMNSLLDTAKFVTTINCANKGQPGTCTSKTTLTPIYKPTLKMNEPSKLQKYGKCMANCINNWANEEFWFLGAMPCQMNCNYAYCGKATC